MGWGVCFLAMAPSLRGIYSQKKAPGKDRGQVCHDWSGLTSGAHTREGSDGRSFDLTFVE